MSGLLFSELGELESNGGEGGGEEQVEHRPEPALYEHGFPRLHIGDALHPLDAPDFAAADPQPVDDNPVEPVHDHQKNRRLRIRRAEGRRAVPDADDQHQRDQHDRAERDHEALAAPHDVAVFGKAAALGLVDIRRRVKIQAVRRVPIRQ